LHECTFALAEVLRRESPIEAMVLFERLREAGYKPADVTVGTAGCLRQLGELDRASALIAPVVAEQPSNVAALVEAAKVDLDRLRPGDAEPRLKRALQLAPKHRDANAQLVRCLLDAPRHNGPVDCYSLGAVDKPTLLKAMHEHFGLRYEIAEPGTQVAVNATGAKPHYYSLNRQAEQFGYRPRYSSLDGVLEEIRALLGRPAPQDKTFEKL
jgi:hypothetical protein